MIQLGQPNWDDIKNSRERIGTLDISFLLSVTYDTSETLTRFRPRFAPSSENFRVSSTFSAAAGVGVAALRFGAAAGWLVAGAAGASADVGVGMSTSCCLSGERNAESKWLMEW